MNASASALTRRAANPFNTAQRVTAGQLTGNRSQSFHHAHRIALRMTERSAQTH